jgi:large subunit ribosomal protein L1
VSSKPGKRYRQAAEAFDRSQEYLPADAIKILKSFPDAKFDETVEIAFRLGIDPRKNDQALRGTVALPHGSGTSVRVGVFAAGE